MNRLIGNIIRIGTHESIGITKRSSILTAGRQWVEYELENGAIVDEFSLREGGWVVRMNPEYRFV